MKTSIKKGALRSATGLTVVALAVCIAASASAQDTSITPPKDENANKADEIIVTGSRIPRTNFNTGSAIDIVTRDDRVLTGARTVADVLQSASVTSGTSQINGSFLGFVSEGGAAANTIGLRGLGSSRTLVLLNGRRLAPAGVGSQLVSADLNVLPTAVVKETQILREGASSIYGSDAIAGVVNIITDTKLEGVTVDGYANQPTGYGAGGARHISIAAGHEFERGHILASFEYQQEDGLRLGDRKEMRCPRALWYDQATGAEVGSIDPATGGLSCFPYAAGSGVGIASGYGIAYFPSGASRVTYDNGDINTLRAVNGLTRVSPSPMQLQDTVISPKKVYTGYLNGSYELGILGDAEIYGEALFTRRESWQDSTYQLSIDQQQLSPNIEIYGGSYAGYPISDFGIKPSPFFPNSIANAGGFLFFPFIVPDREARSSQRVDYVRANAGLRGSLGIGDWAYDANFQYSHTKGRYSTTLVTSDHLSNALETVEAPAGTPTNLITYAVAGQAGARTGYTCASNVDSGGNFIAGSTCAPLNMYDPNILIGGHIPAAVYNYLFENIVGHTTFDERTISLNTNGTLFNLPAGPLAAAIGFEHRYDAIDDVPSEAAQNGTLYNFSSAGITKGSDVVNEVYGELNIPIIKDKPFFYDLEANVSGRYTHYRSYGSDFTYNIKGMWAPAEIIGFRAHYGTSFRAPNLYEQFVADQTGFYPGGADPCNGFATTYAVGSTRYNNCLAALEPILGNAGALGYIANSGPEVITRGGHGLLKAETSTNWGIGATLTLPPSMANVSFSVDYWNLKVKDEVYTLGNLVLDRCYDSTDFPNNQYCDLIAPRLTTGQFPGTLDYFYNPYLNVAQQKASGIDFDLRYQAQLFGGRFLVKGQATRNLHQIFQLFSTDAPIDYNGTLGQQGAGAGPKWVATANFDYTIPDGSIRFHYGVTYVGKQDSTDLIGQFVAPFGLGAVDTDFVAEAYWEHEAAIQFNIQDLGAFTVGVKNLFDAHPPTVSQIPGSGNYYNRIGNYFNSSNYDYYGRQVFVNLTHTIK